MRVQVQDCERENVRSATLPGMEFQRECGHICPVCGNRFLSETLCRGVYPDFHPEPVQTLPLYGCQRPPLRPYRIMLEGVGVRAEGPTQARAIARRTIQDLLGGETKIAAKMAARLDCWIGAVEEIDEDELNRLAAAIEAVRDERLHGAVVVGVPSRRQRAQAVRTAPELADARPRADER